MTELADLRSQLAEISAKVGGDGDLHAVVSISDSAGQVVIAARGKTEPLGVLYELDEAKILPYASSVEAIGLAVLDALALYRIAPRDLRKSKLSDWPSYRASGLPSVRKFEATFIRVEVGRWQNHTIHLVSQSIGSDELQITSTLGGAEPEVLGSRLLKIAQACSALRKVVRP